MPAVPPASPVPSTARLLDHAYRMRWRLPDDGGVRRLGESVPSSGNELPLPGSSGRPARAAPARSVEIVDRWLAADGSHNVVLRAPSGNLLCGRAEAWDPLRPLVEHVTMFGACGNGEPTFEWPDRYGTAAPPPLATAVVQ